MRSSIKHIFLSRWGGWLLLPIFLLFNWIGFLFPLRLDLTADNRYTLSDATSNLVKSIDQPITIDVFLKGEFPSGFQKLADATQDFLELIKNENPNNIQFRFISPDELQDNYQPYADTLIKMGAMPINLSVQIKAGQSTNLLFPYAWIRSGDRQRLVPLFSGSKGKISQKETNNAESLLEYQFASALQNFSGLKRSFIAYDTSHGEPINIRGYDLDSTLKSDYKFGLLNMRGYLTIPPMIDVLMIVKPTIAFSEDDKIKLDQFVMRGGKLLLFIDNLIAEQDSLRMNEKGETIAYDRNLQLTDLLFRYGCRINTDLVMDLQSESIPFIVGASMENPQMEYLRWNYYPLANGAGPIFKNLGYVSLRFANSIDTIEVPGIKKTPILVSSPHSRTITTPALISLNENRNAPVDDNFQRANIPIGVMMEGSFPSLYANRLPSSWRDSLQRAGTPFQNRSVPNRMIVVADGDLALNDFVRNEFDDKPIPLAMGYNKYTYMAYLDQLEGGQYFVPAANRDFLKMAIEQLAGDPDIMNTRNKEIVLRLLDAQKIEASRTRWQVLNLVLPLLVLTAFGLAYQLIRKKRYSGV